MRGPYNDAITIDITKRLRNRHFMTDHR